MTKKTIILLICSIIIFALAITIFVVAQNQKSTKPAGSANNTNVTQNNIEQEKHEFNFYDTDGNEYSLDSFSDKPIAILLWRSDADNALDYVELFEKYYNEYSSKINMLVINTNEPDNNILEHVINSNFQIPIYFDKNNYAYEEFLFSKLPYFVFYEGDGTVSNEKEANMTEDAFLANLDLIAKNY